MKSLPRILIGVTLTLVVAATVFLAGRRSIRDAASIDEPPSELVGKPAPALRVRLADGGQFDLAELRGKVVVLDFWATWCPPCVELMPETIETVKKYAADGVELYAVNSHDHVEQINAFLAEHKLSVPVPLAADLKILSAYNVQYLPQLVVIDRNGIVRGVSSNTPRFHEWLPATIESAIKSGQASGQ